MHTGLDDRHFLEKALCMIEQKRTCSIQNFAMDKQGIQPLQNSDSQKDSICRHA